MIKKLLLIIFGILITVNCYGAITYDTAAGANLSGSTITISLAIANNSNRMLIVGVGSEGLSSIDYGASGITYNGVAMTKIDSQGYDIAPSDNYQSLWYLLAPDVGTYNVVVSFTNLPVGASAIAISLYNVAQQAPEASAKIRESADGSITRSITTITNNAWLVDIFCDNFSTVDGTPGTGQTGRGRQSNLQDTEMSTKPVASAGATSVSWDTSGGWGDNQGIIVASFAPYVAPTARRIIPIQ